MTQLLLNILQLRVFFITCTRNFQQKRIRDKVVDLYEAKCIQWGCAQEKRILQRKHWQIIFEIVRINTKKIPAVSLYFHTRVRDVRNIDLQSISIISACLKCQDRNDQQCGYSSHKAKIKKARQITPDLNTMNSGNYYILIGYLIKLSSA